MKSFKEFLEENFNDTQVCLRKGRPMKVYRGISKNVEERHPSSSLGTFASPHKEIAKSYAGKEGKLHSIHMNIKNPHHMSSLELNQLDDDVKVKNLKNKLTKKGHDGIFIHSELDQPNAVREYIAFHPHQIKHLETE